MITRPRRKIIVVLALIIGLAAWFLTADIDWSQWTVRTIRDQVERWGVWAPTVYVVGFTPRILFLIPGSLMTLAGMVLFGPWWGILYVTLGTTLCAIVEFGIARWLGRETVERYVRNTRLLRRCDQYVANHGLGAVLLIRLVPNVPFDLQNVGLALSPVRWSQYLVGTVLGMLPWTIVYAFLGNAITDFRNFWKLLLGLLALVVLIWGPWLWQKHRGAARLDTPLEID